MALNLIVIFLKHQADLIDASTIQCIRSTAGIKRDCIINRIVLENL